jgi:hypothetical protein
MLNPNKKKTNFFSEYFNFISAEKVFFPTGGNYNYFEIKIWGV